MATVREGSALSVSQNELFDRAFHVTCPIDPQISFSVGSGIIVFAGPDTCGGASWGGAVCGRTLNVGPPLSWSASRTCTYSRVKLAIDVTSRHERVNSSTGPLLGHRSIGIASLTQVSSISIICQLENGVLPVQVSGYKRALAKRQLKG
jgi:hypothetical protein